MLSELQLIALLDASETRLVERKVSMPNAAEVRKTLVAFANTVEPGEHAVLFLGLGDDGQKKGVENADGVQKKVREIAENECFPPVRCEPQVIRISGVEIVAVVVPMSKNRPHFAGHAYVRRGSESVKASNSIFEEMISARSDKARKILSLRGQSISVRFTGNKNAVEGSMGREFMPRDRRTYRIDECDGHYARIFDVNAGRIYTPSLEHLALEFDAIAHRPRLVVNENA